MPTLEKQRTIRPGHPPVGMSGSVTDDIRLGFDNATAGVAFGQLPHQHLADEIAGESDGINRQLRAREQQMAILMVSRSQGIRSTHCAREGPGSNGSPKYWVSRATFPSTELHDAHGVRQAAVIGQDIFSDPEVARADYPPHSEAFPVRLRGARRLDVAPPADALARLRIFEHRVLSINVVLRLEIVRIGRGPVAIQSRLNLAVVHIEFPTVDGEPLYHATRSMMCPSLGQQSQIATEG